jgi:Pyridoxal-phosphate dependent enzyme
MGRHVQLQKLPVLRLRAKATRFVEVRKDVHVRVDDRRHGGIRIAAVLSVKDTERVRAPLGPAQIRERYVSMGVPRVPLARLPTPLQEAPRLASELGLGRLLIKDESDVESYDDYVETAYGEPSRRGLDAMRLAARLEGLMLDPIYTAKAMAGLIDHARAGKLGAQSTVVFVHTGGLPAMFAFKDEILNSLSD